MKWSLMSVFFKNEICSERTIVCEMERFFFFKFVINIRLESVNVPCAKIITLNFILQ